MASTLELSPYHVAGLCLALWCWFDRESTDGTITFPLRGSLDAAEKEDAVRRIVDRQFKQPGYAAALEVVGWLVIVGASASIPNWDRHNSGTAKGRALTARRVQRGRDSPSVGGPQSPQNAPTAIPASVDPPAPPKTAQRGGKRAKRPPPEGPEGADSDWEHAQRGAEGRCNAASVTPALRDRYGQRNISVTRSSSESELFQSSEIPELNSEGTGPEVLNSEGRRGKRRTGSAIKAKLEAEGEPLLLAKLRAAGMTDDKPSPAWIVDQIASLCHVDKSMRGTLRQECIGANQRPALKVLMKAAARFLARGGREQFDNPGAWLRATLREDGLNV